MGTARALVPGSDVSCPAWSWRVSNSVEGERRASAKGPGCTWTVRREVMRKWMVMVSGRWQRGPRRSKGVYYTVKRSGTRSCVAAPNGNTESPRLLSPSILPRPDHPPPRAPAPFLTVRQCPRGRELPRRLGAQRAALRYHCADSARGRQSSRVTKLGNKYKEIFRKPKYFKLRLTEKSLIQSQVID